MKNKSAIHPSCLTSISDLTLLPKVTTVDKSWVYGYDPEIQTQSSQWKTPTSPTPKKAHQSRTHVNVMLSLFFDMDGIV
jgi:hypothetical protein